MGVGMVVKWTRNPTQAAPPPPVRIVSRDEAGAFPTITAALQEAQAGTRIVLRAASWEEALCVPADLPAELSIEGQSPDGSPVLWRAPPGNAEDQPLLRVLGRTSLRLSGITLDGEDRLQTLISLAGACRTLHLDDCELRGFRRTAILFQRSDTAPASVAP
jgi:hypothetical protein